MIRGIGARGFRVSKTAWSKTTDPPWCRKKIVPGKKKDRDAASAGRPVPPGAPKRHHSCVASHRSAHREQLLLHVDWPRAGIRPAAGNQRAADGAPRRSPARFRPHRSAATSVTYGAPTPHPLPDSGGCRGMKTAAAHRQQSVAPRPCSRLHIAEKTRVRRPIDHRPLRPNSPSPGADHTSARRRKDPTSGGNGWVGRAPSSSDRSQAERRRVGTRQTSARQTPKLVHRHSPSHVALRFSAIQPSLRACRRDRHPARGQRAIPRKHRVSFKHVRPGRGHRRNL